MNKSKVGRPTLKNKKVTQSIRLSPDVKLWLDEQEQSNGKLIEKAVRLIMNEQTEMDV